MGASFQTNEHDFKYPDWQTPLLEAVLEIDRDKLRERLTVAEMIISKRRETISQRADHEDERQAIDDALQTLRVLKR